MSSLVGKVIQTRKGKSHAPKQSRRQLVDHIDRFYIIKKNHTYIEERKIQSRDRRSEQEDLPRI